MLKLKVMGAVVVLFCLASQVIAQTSDLAVRRVKEDAIQRVLGPQLEQFKTRLKGKY